jgi:hypothetical protein
MEELKVVRSSRVVIELKETKPGFYEGTGAIFSMLTEPPKPLYELRAEYNEASVVSLCSIQGPDELKMNGTSMQDFRGGFTNDASGDEHLEAKTRSNPAGGELQMMLWRQDNGPDKVSQGTLSIQFASVDPAETPPGEPVTLRYEFRARDILEAPFKYQEKLTVTGPGGEKLVTPGGSQQLDYQHGSQGPGSLDAHGVRVCKLPGSTQTGQYTCRIEITAAGYTRQGTNRVTFRVVATNAPPPASSSGFDSVLASEGHPMDPETLARFKKGFEVHDTNNAAYWAQRRRKLEGKDAQLFNERFKSDRNPDDSQTNATPAAEEVAPQLNIRMAAPVLELIAGDLGQIDGVFVSGWKRNSSDRVEADLGVVDVGGDLKVNRRINAAPGDTSAMSANMDGPEYYFSEIWTAKIGARPGPTRVPIIVRQGLANAATYLNVWILPRDTRLASSGMTSFLNPPGGVAPNVQASNQISASSPANPQEINLQPANDLFKQQRFADALQMLDPIVTKHPESRDARFLRGRTRMWLNDLRGAREDFSQLAGQNPADYESQRRVVELKLMIGDRRAALQKASTLAKAEPDNIMLACVYAYAAAVNQDTGTAQRVYAEVAKKAPTLAGRLYAEARRLQQAGVPLMAFRVTRPCCGSNHRIIGLTMTLAPSMRTLANTTRPLMLFNGC